MKIEPKVVRMTGPKGRYNHRRGRVRGNDRGRDRVYNPIEYQVRTPKKGRGR